MCAQSYNELSDDLRDDEETRSELHQQVDDLREALWSICDERKEQAEKERTGAGAQGAGSFCCNSNLWSVCMLKFGLLVLIPFFSRSLSFTRHAALLKPSNCVSDVMNAGWLEDHLALLCNLYTTLLQGEVDRFQDTVRMLKDYYRGMEGKIPDEASPEYARIPLIEVRTDEIGTRRLMLHISVAVCLTTTKCDCE